MIRLPLDKGESLPVPLPVPVCTVDVISGHSPLETAVGQQIAPGFRHFQPVYAVKVDAAPFVSGHRLPGGAAEIDEDLPFGFSPGKFHHHAETPGRGQRQELHGVDGGFHRGHCEGEGGIFRVEGEVEFLALPIGGDSPSGKIQLITFAVVNRLGSFSRCRGKHQPDGLASGTVFETGRRRKNFQRDFQTAVGQYFEGLNSGIPDHAAAFPLQCPDELVSLFCDFRQLRGVGAPIGFPGFGDIHGAVMRNFRKCLAIGADTYFPVRRDVHGLIAADDAVFPDENGLLQFRRDRSFRLLFFPRLAGVDFGQRRRRGKGGQRGQTEQIVFHVRTDFFS